MTSKHKMASNMDPTKTKKTGKNPGVDSGARER